MSLEQEHDRLYYWTALGHKGERVLIGEVNRKHSYNMSFSIDGLKDTARLSVFSTSISEPLKPFSVVWHERSNTYWIISKDKVNRIVNEVGYVYEHSISLEGAIELFNARDLTDCGFYQKRYTIEQFVIRLLKLSTFELGIYGNTTINFGGNIDGNKIVDYIKTFENYTLLSALREFFDGYNCSARLSFTQEAETNRLTTCVINVLSKTGDKYNTPVDIDSVMTSVEGESSIDKGSYGTTVVSNADNVISTKSKVYPTVGYARLGSEDFYLDVEKDNVVFRLPSKVSSVEYVEACDTGATKIAFGYFQSNVFRDYYEFEFDPSDPVSYEKAIGLARAEFEHFRDLLDASEKAYINQRYGNSFWNNVLTEDYRQDVLSKVAFRFYDVDNYDPIQNKFISDHPIQEFNSIRTDLGHASIKPYVLGNKDLRNRVQEPQSVMYWERGSNLIRGFNFFSWHDYISYSKQINSATRVGMTVLSDEIDSISFQVAIGNIQRDLNGFGCMYINNIKLDYRSSSFRVKYTPMTDLKIKYDNYSTGRDSKLYNQNGKYTDGVALSKLLLSYKDEIESDTITRSANGYSIASLPRVGDSVMKDGVKYVIGNASYNISTSEIGDYVQAQYTLSKKIATKTALTNPNTNIRDYGIPQSYNVRRKQLTRDFYELAYSVYDENNVDQQAYKLPLDQVINFTMASREFKGHTALVKIAYAQPCGGGGESYDHTTVQPSSYWYFQVDSTRYVLKKSIYEVFDFQDNNIIGYDNQNINVGWDIRRVFENIVVGTSELDAVNTPISYVDDKGEFEHIDLAVVNAENLKLVWDTYIEDMENSYSRTGTDSYFYNRCVFIPKDVYDLGVSNQDYHLTNNHYDKDATEVPVFEYCCQVDDSEDVVIGDNVLDEEDDDSMYFYEAFIVPYGAYDNNNWSINFTPSTIYDLGNGTLELDEEDGVGDRKVVRIGRANNHIANIFALTIHNTVSFDGNTANFGSFRYIRSWLNEYSGKVDMIIVRYTVKKNFHSTDGVVDGGVSTDLMFILRDVKQANIVETSSTLPSSSMVLYANHYSVN